MTPVQINLVLNRIINKTIQNEGIIIHNNNNVIISIITELTFIFFITIDPRKEDMLI